MRLSFTVFTIIVATTATAAEARQQDYYLDTSAVRCGANVKLNGFTLMLHNQGTKNLSRVITPYILDGKNTLKIEYLPHAKSNLNSSLSVEAIVVPEGDRPSSDEARVTASFKSGSQRLAAAKPKAPVDVIVGERVKRRGGILRFSKTGESFQLAFRLRGSNQFERVPSALKYIILPDTPSLSDVEVHFFNDHGSARVVYELGDLDKGAHELTLNTKQLRKGDPRFAATNENLNMMLIKAGASTQEPPELMQLEVMQIRYPIRKTLHFQATTHHSYTWHDGQQLGKLPNRFPDELWRQVNKLHKAIEAGDTNTIAKLMKAKTRDLSKLTGRTRHELQRDQTKHFKGLALRDNWGLVPMQKNQLRVVRLNDRVVKVERLDGTSAIISEPVERPNGKMGTFKMTLRYARIEDRWTLIQ